MSAKILDGKACSEQALELISKNIGDTPPTLVIYRIGDDPASAVYVRNKVRAAARVGIIAIVREFLARENPYYVMGLIEEDAKDPDIDGIMVQLPLPDEWDATELIECEGLLPRCCWLADQHLCRHLRRIRCFERCRH